MDEMSRYRYVEHTNALHKYAALVEGRVRTLFSCRIADFAPTFYHRRLVLLPFDRRHVQAYLHRQFVGELIELNGQFLTARQLSERLVSDELAVRATNPYVLYLLSLYIQNNKTIPVRRTDLLGYYFAFAIERKEAELEALHLPPDRDTLFAVWARVALAIAEANAWLAILPIVFIYAVLAKLIEPWVEAVADRIGLSTFYSSWWSYVVLTLLLWLGYILLFPLISPIRTRRSFDFVRDFREGAKSWRLVAIGLVWIAGSLVVGKIFSFLGDLLKMLDRFSFGLAYILYALVLLLSLALLAALVFVTYSLLRPVLQQMQRIAGQTKHIDIVQWMEDVRDSTPGQQAWLLGTADPARFGISLEETIEAFASLQSEIHQEPARSAYDARMNELVAIRRQRRTG
jgi:hypothetical protein